MVNNFIKLRGGALLFLLFVSVLVGACTPDSRAPVSATRDSADVGPTPLPSPTEVLPTPQPTATTAVAPPPTATPEPRPTTDPGQGETEALPVLNVVDITLVDHAGGVPYATAVEGPTAYIGFGPRLAVYDVSDRAAPRLLGQSPPLGDIIRDVVVDDDHAFVAAGQAGLVVLDLSDATQPAIVDAGPGYEVEITAAAEQIALAGDRLFVTNFNRQQGDTSLIWFDASDPTDVTFAGSLGLQVNDSAVIAGDLVLVVGNGRLEVRTIAEPAVVVGRQTLRGASYTSQAVVVDDVAYIALAGERNGFARYDLSDPANPREIGELTPMEFFFVNQPVSDGQTLVTVSTFGEFGHCGSQIFVVAIGDTLAQESQFDPKNCALELALADQTLYVAGRVGVQLYDLAEPANPRLLSTIMSPAGFLDAPGFALDPQDDRRAFLRTDNGQTFDLVTISLEGEIRPAAERMTVGTRTLLDVFAVGETLVVPEWMGGLNTLAIGADGRPQLLYQPAENDLVAGDHYAMAVSGDVLYTTVIEHKSSDGSPTQGLIGAVGAVDLSDPAQPRVAAVVETGEPQVLDIAVASDTLFALNQGQKNQVVIFDIADRLSPRVVSAVALPEPASRVAAAGNTLYVACDKWNCQHLYAFDITDRTQPALVDRWRLPFGVQEMIAGPDNLIFLTTVDEGFGILDVGDPARPALVGYQPTPPTFMRLVLAGDTLYAAAFDAGLYVYRIAR